MSKSMEFGDGDIRIISVGMPKALDKGPGYPAIGVFADMGDLKLIGEPHDPEKVMLTIFLITKFERPIDAEGESTSVDVSGLIALDNEELVEITVRIPEQYVAIMNTLAASKNDFLGGMPLHFIDTSRVQKGENDRFSLNEIKFLLALPPLDEEAYGTELQDQLSIVVPESHLTPLAPVPWDAVEGIDEVGGSHGDEIPVFIRTAQGLLFRNLYAMINNTPGAVANLLEVEELISAHERLKAKVVAEEATPEEIEEYTETKVVPEMFFDLMRRAFSLMLSTTPQNMPRFMEREGEGGEMEITVNNIFNAITASDDLSHLKQMNAGGILDGGLFEKTQKIWDEPFIEEFPESLKGLQGQLRERPDYDELMENLRIDPNDRVAVRKMIDNNSLTTIALGRMILLAIYVEKKARILSLRRGEKVDEIGILSRLLTSPQDDFYWELLTIAKPLSEYNLDYASKILTLDIDSGHPTPSILWTTMIEVGERIAFTPPYDTMSREEFSETVAQFAGNSDDAAGFVEWLTDYRDYILAFADDDTDDLDDEMVEHIIEQSDDDDSPMKLGLRYLVNIAREEPDFRVLAMRTARSLFILTEAMVADEPDVEEFSSEWREIRVEFIYSIMEDIAVSLRGRMRGVSLYG